jgi:hypothetical protein
MRTNKIVSLAAGASVVLAGVCAGAADASAQSGFVKATFESYRLLGIFAVDCSKPPAADSNFYYVHRLLDPGHVQRDRMSSETKRDYSNVIDKALARGSNEVTVSGTRMEGNRKGDPVVEVWRVEGDRLVTMEATIGHDQVIKDRKFNGHELGWLNRCPDQQVK